MNITSRGRFREAETGAPVDILELTDSVYDEVRITLDDARTATLTATRDDECIETITFDVLSERYLGLDPNGRSHTALDDTLRSALLSAGYVAVDTTETEVNTNE